ncbi:hypothetical protein Acsp06_56920 [Actinomycetospora sp. NBRC 106375]|uniref:hypothetical protein n=1 Tax=Actinomycetospora sp. NBRC 106375 TaxID=3032207 RepID=UPI0024A410C8|nr:hypothetical protein [Actinomycetospora sp. NBRC 106375]GLZ49507.1 hypothetical protein Acsp06_56920 [Actinomycetospora sp. NBRC 106375]
MAACAFVLVLAGLVAVVAVAVTADRAVSVRAAADERAAADADPPPSSSPAPEPSTDPSTEPPTAPSTEPATGPSPEPSRPASATPEAAPPGDEAAPVTDDVTGTTLALPPGWQVVPSQDVVEVPPERFRDATIVRRADTVVLVGLADPARVPPRADPGAPDPAGDEALDAEARRLADAYADLLQPDARTAALTDNPDPVADLPTRTSVRRVEGGPQDGALVRVSTLAAPGRTVAVLAVARPSPIVDADGDAADAVVRSLRLAPAPGEPGAPAERGTPTEPGAPGERGAAVAPGEPAEPAGPASPGRPAP